MSGSVTVALNAPKSYQECREPATRELPLLWGAQRSRRKSSGGDLHCGRQFTGIRRMVRNEPMRGQQPKSERCLKCPAMQATDRC